MSAVSSYLVISSRLLSIHLSLGRPLLLFSGTTMSFIFLLGCLLLFSWHVRTNVIFFVSGMLTFGTLWHPLVLSGFWHGPFWSYPLSILASSFVLQQSVLVFLSNRPTLCSICHCWLDHRLYTLSFSLMGTFLSHSTPVCCFHFTQASLTRLLMSLAAPPFESKIDPKYLNVVTVFSVSCISS